MRVSTRKNDIGYRLNAYDYSVTLNGVELDCCFTADEEEGKVWLYDNEASEIVKQGVVIITKN